MYKETQIILPYNPPLNWEILLSFFRSHQIIGVERITNTSYERNFKLDGIIGSLRVTHHDREPQLILNIFTDHQTILPVLEQRIRKMFDLNINFSAFSPQFLQHPLFSILWMQYPGLRLASGWDAFETAINTILGQLVSVSRAKDLTRQLVELHGEQIIHPITHEKAYLFPTPKKLVDADLTALGTTQVRKKTIKEFSRRVVDKEIDLETRNIDSLKTELLTIPGIGPWSVEYIALRALGDVDSFPATDLILKRAIEKYPDMEVEKLRPWRSYAAVYLWKHATEW